ncbi:MAG: bifunctional folylpolyglutamate synthase/dihydrofolate synthase [Ruminococcaceae bacterium]|nr:bifunctional folylpolyglutamate synthase/dihydrofolate synthase [Oscillospiraceae bacterium]
MNYQEALDYIHSVCWKGSRPGLERTVELTDRLGRPQDHLKFIHVAGTNGKGSTSAMLASILQKAGYRVGLYTSPFILRFNERMKIDGQDIPDEELAEVTARVRPHADAMADTPTEFELITAIALCYFAKHHCDYVVFEVGMGGRLDSTNIIDAETVVASVITGIAMDHTAFLGDTPEKIAAEKAGIIKAGVPVVYGGYHPAVGEAAPSPEAISCGEVIRQKANEMDAPYLVTDHTKLSNVSADLFGCAFDFEDYKGLHIPLAGLYQPHNAANVLTVVEVIRSRGLVIPEEAVRAGLADVYWPGRFEILSRSPLIIADGGHNPEGIDAAIASVKAYFGKEKILLLTGVMADKDYTHMVARMGEVTARAFCVRPANDRALDAAKYAEAFRAIDIPAEGYATVAEGVGAASATAAAEGKALLCLGSLYMYGEVREAVLGE